MTQNLPQDFVNRIKNQLGEEAEPFLLSYENDFCKSLRVNNLKNKSGIVGRKSGNAIELQNVNESCKVLWERSGLYYSEPDDDNSDDTLCLDAPGKSPLHAAGAYYIQEASAMLPVTMLEIESDDRARGLKVLDLCAAPGGKSTQIADRMRGKGLLVCNEIVPSRAKILSENIERMGVANAIVISADPEDLVGRFAGFFDRILVDAPCSGEGMFRKHPEACEQWSLENVDMCANRQAGILDCAAKMLAPGGKIVYSTCTFSVQEDEECAKEFVARNSRFVVDSDFCRLFPHRERGEGHFAVRFADASGVRIETYDDGFNAKGGTKKKKGASSSDPGKSRIELFEDFCRCNLHFCEALGAPEGSDFSEGLSENIKARLCMFGDRMYLLPEYYVDLSRLSVYRSGLCLGSFIKERFEPDHAFAMCLSRDNVKRSVSYAADDVAAVNYLKGYTDSVDGDNGWYLVCVEDMSMGWGKVANRVLKNHYPKGLRIKG